MSRSGLFIYRPVVEESLPQIQNGQQYFSEQLEDAAFTPIEDPHLTVFDTVRQLTPYVKRKILHPAPDSAANRIEFGVGSIEFNEPPNMLGQSAIALYLRDPADMFQAERRAFVNRFTTRTRALPRYRNPHVTLGYAETAKLTSDVVDKIKLKMYGILGADTITFGAIRSVPEIKPIIVQTDRPAWTGRPDPSPAEGTVRRVVENGIPSGFLATLRQAINPETQTELP